MSENAFDELKDTVFRLSYCSFGKLRRETKGIEFAEDGVKIMGINTILPSSKFRFNLTIPFDDLSKILVVKLSDVKTTIIIRPGKVSRDLIRQALQTGDLFGQNNNYIFNNYIVVTSNELNDKLDAIKSHLGSCGKLDDTVDPNWIKDLFAANQVEENA